MQRPPEITGHAIDVFTFNLQRGEFILTDNRMGMFMTIPFASPLGIEVLVGISAWVEQEQAQEAEDES